MQAPRRILKKNSAKGRQKDCEARWAKKNNETHFGWKNHTKTDAKTKLIATQVTTDASVHDNQTFTELVDSSDQRLLAGSAYHSEEREAYVLKDCDAEEFLIRKGQRNAPLNMEEEQRNKRISKIRVRVEHVFGRISQMGVHYCWSISLARAKQHNSLCNLIYNMDRYAFLMR